MTQQREIQKRADVPTLKALFENSRSSIEAVIPKHLTPDRLLKVALVAVSRSQSLQECTAHSVLQCVMTAAELGLDCGGSLGSAYMVPYRNKKTGTQEAQFIVGYRGLIDLARRSGQIATIEARLVYKADEFVLEYGLNPVLVHRPKLDGPRGDIRLVYSIARLKDGAEQIEVMTNEEVAAIRKRSRASDNGPWVTDPGEMTRKTVVRRICKYLPLSPQLQRALEIEDRAESGDVSLDIPMEAAQAALTKSEMLAKQLATPTAAAGEEPQPHPPEDESQMPPVEREGDYADEPQFGRV